MSKTKAMQEKDERMVGSARERVYRGDDATLTHKGEMGRVTPTDHGARPLIGKFSTLNLYYMEPEQRRVFLEQLRYEMTLSGKELNDYLTQRYEPEDLAEAWRIVNLSNPEKKRKLGTVAPKKTKSRKRAISLKQKRRVETPEQKEARIAKAKATRERNKKDPNYVSYGTLKREFTRRQKLLAARYEETLRQATALYAQPIIEKEVKKRTRKLERENQTLKEYLRQNNLPLPGTKAAKMRREELRAEED